jgi:hypothetical protein
MLLYTEERLILERGEGHGTATIVGILLVDRLRERNFGFEPPS